MCRVDWHPACRCRGAMRRPSIHWFLIAVTAVAGCAADVDGWPKDDPNATPNDVADALAAMPEARVIEWTDNGMPRYIVGEMVKAGAMQSTDVGASDAALRTMIPPVLKA